MSVENLKKFGMLCAQNEEVRKRAKEIGLNDLDGLMAYGREMELEFSSEDLAALAREAGVSRQELSEEQLEQVAGGFVTATAVMGVAALAGMVAAGVALAGVATLGIAAAVGSCDNW